MKKVDLNEIHPIKPLENNDFTICMVNNAALFPRLNS